MISKLATKDVQTTEFTPHTDVIELQTDSSVFSRMGWIIVLLGIGSFFIWAFFAPLDKGVPLSGSVAVASSKKTIQHQNGGTVDEILVKEDDTVKAGQVLVRMNSVVSKANFEIARAQFLSTRASEARLIAERDGTGVIRFPKELEDAKKEPRIAESILLQQQLFAARQASTKSDLAAVEENIAGLRATAKGLQESMLNKKQQLGFLKEQLDGMRDLAKEGFVARNRMLDQERAYAQSTGSISEDLGSIARVQSQILEQTLRRNQRQLEYQKEIRTQLSDIQRDVQSMSSRLDSAQYDLNNVLVKAPVDGIVVGLNLFTIGGVVPPGFKMMDIVPAGDALVIDGQVPVQMIDKVYKDLPIVMSFAAFNQNTTPHVPGIVTQVSADRFVDERTGQAYYKLRAKVTPEGMKKLTNLQVRPGMPVELFVKTGERNFMSYLFKPVFDRANTALTEE
jgi:protease secretion system membrane fusion protein